MPCTTFYVQCNAQHLSVFSERMCISTEIIWDQLCKICYCRRDHTCHREAVSEIIQETKVEYLPHFSLEKMFLSFEPGVCLFCLHAPIFLGFDKPPAWESEKLMCFTSSSPWGHNWGNNKMARQEWISLKGDLVNLLQVIIFNICLGVIPWILHLCGAWCRGGRLSKYKILVLYH